MKNKYHPERGPGLSIQLEDNIREIEQSALGSMLLDPANIALASTMVHSDDFGDLRHRALFQTLIETWRGRDIDLAVIRSKCLGLTLDDGAQFDDVARVIAKCMETVGSPSNLMYYVKLLTEHSTRRKIDFLALQISNIGRDLSISGAEELLGKCTDLLSGLENHVLRDETTDAHIQRLNAELRIEMENFNADDSTSLEPLKTGISDLDELLTIMPGQLSVIAARPSDGKTAIAMNIAANLARDGKSVLFFSLEMTAQELHNRLACSLAGVDASKRYKRTLMENERTKISEATRQMSDWNIIFDSPSRPTATQLISRCRVHQRKHGLDVVFVDFLTMLSPENFREDKHEQICRSVGILKVAARELNIPVILLAQLNRESVKAKRPPVLSDLKGSGAIEELSDNVVMISHKVELGDRKTNNIDDAFECDLKIEKQRNGITGRVPVMWFPVLTRFESRAAKHFDNYSTEFDDFNTGDQ